MAKGLFVTGTDTGIGKTVATVAILRGLAAAGLRAAGMKPVAAGLDDGEAVSPDVAAHAAAANVDAPLTDRNPYAFAPPIAPHLAAREAGVAIDLSVVSAAYHRLAAVADAIVVEGAGGALVPIDERHDMLDIAAALDIPVVLVVGLKLGCLNHALLSALAIRARGLPFAGWIAARVDPRMLRATENLASLEAGLGTPPIADLTSAAPAPLSAASLARLSLIDPPRR